MNNNSMNSRSDAEVNIAENKLNQTNQPFLTYQNSQNGDINEQEEIKVNPSHQSPHLTVSPTDLDNGSRDPNNLRKRGQALFSDTDFGYLNDSAIKTLSNDKQYQMNQTIEMQALGASQRLGTGQIRHSNPPEVIQSHDGAIFSESSLVMNENARSQDRGIIQKAPPARETDNQPVQSPQETQTSQSGALKSRVGTLPPLQLSSRVSVQLQLNNQFDHVTDNRREFSPANFDISGPVQYESRNIDLKLETENTQGRTAIEAQLNEADAPRHTNQNERDQTLAARKGSLVLGHTTNSGNNLFESGESLAQIDDNIPKLEPTQQFTEAQKAKLSVVISAFSGDAAAAKMRAEQERLRIEQSKLLNMQQSKDGAAFKFRGLKDERGHSKFVVYDKRSLFVFGAETKFRNAIVWLTCWPGFDNFIIVMITVNSLFLAAYDYGDRDNLGQRNRLIEKAGLVFTATFTLESIIKITAMGFCVHKNSYLRDPWNWLDFLVVCIGIIEFVPADALPDTNLKPLRTLRILRPLRSINAFPSMRRLISSLLAALPRLGNAVLFLLFIFLLFGILGVQQFGGVLYQRCRIGNEPVRDPSTGEFTHWPIADGIDRLCGMDGLGLFQCPEPYVCGYPGMHGLTLESDDVKNQPLISYGIVTFDHLGVALITIFQMITMEGWTDIMYNLSDASLPWMAVSFCCMLVLMGSFFLLNVVLAVIMSAFDEVDKNTIELEKKKEKDLKELQKIYGYEQTDSESSGSEVGDGAAQIESIQSENEEPQVYEGEASNILRNTIVAGGPVPPSVSGRNEGHTLQAKRPGGHSSMMTLNQPARGLEIKQAGPASPSRPRLQRRSSMLTKVADDPRSASSKKDQTPESALRQLGSFKAATAMNSIRIPVAKQPKALKTAVIPERAKSNAIFRICFQVSTHNAFNVTLTTCIILNTYLLALDRYPIEKHQQRRLENFNVILSVAFLVEMIVKITGLGVKDYAADSFNLFDGAVVVISVVDFILARLKVGFGGGGAVSALRAVRLLRVFKLARSWTSFRELLQKIVVTLKDVRNFAVLMMIFMFIYALLGMELYAYKVIFSDSEKTEVATELGAFPRANFNTFLRGITTVFIVLIGEDWNQSMYDHVRSSGYGAVFFFISLFVLGNLILLNLFLAILLKNFEEPPGRDADDETVDGEGMILKLKQALCCCAKRGQPVVGHNSDRLSQQSARSSERERTPKSQLAKEAMPEKNGRGGSPENYKRSEDGGPRLQPEPGQDDLQRVRTEPLEREVGQAKGNIDVDKEDEQRLSSDERSQPSLPRRGQHPRAGGHEGGASELNEGEVGAAPDKETDKRGPGTISRALSLSSIKQLEVQKARQTKAKTIPLFGVSLYMMRRDNAFRKICRNIVGHQHFDTFILLMIALSTILLTLESPLADPQGQRQRVLAQIDAVVSAIFTIELLLKVVVYGFILNGPDSYLRGAWNIMDCVIVTVSLISLAAAGVDLGVLKILRTLRLLRPLRLISGNPGLRVAVHSLLNAVPDIGNVLVVSTLFLLLFAILGTNLYKGTFYRCHTENIPAELIPRIKDKFDCMDFGGDWVNEDQHFDNVGSSIVTLFNVMTTEGWIGVMWNAVDAAGIDEVPVEDNSPTAVLFFFLFMVVGSLFILNMFVGIVINVFNAEKETLLMNHLLTPTQRDWCEVLVSCYGQTPLVKFSSTGNQLKDLCHAVATYWLFDHLIFVCIVLNTICLALTWYGEPSGLAAALETVNLAFNIIYTIEALIKLTAFGADYFSEGWNNFDFIIVLAAWLGSAASRIDGLDIGASTTVIRSFRISRIFKIVKQYKSLRILFYTFIGALPQLTNVGGLLFLFLFLYAVLGVALFAPVKLQGTLDVHANFQTFGLAVQTLYRMATGEAWHELMYDCARPRSITFECKVKQTFEELQRDGVQGCGSPAASYVYFISFMIVVSMIFLNLFIAIILESFANAEGEESLQVSAATRAKFCECWVRFDPKGKGYIAVSEFPRFLDMILTEEIKQIYQTREQLTSGEIDAAEAEIRIFMFNLHKQEHFLAAASRKRDKIFSKLEREAANDGLEDIKIVNKSQEDPKNEQNSSDLEYEELYSEEKSISGLSPEELDVKKSIRKGMNQFISGLQMPCYDKIRNYYFYDVLEALSRSLFQNLLHAARKDLLDEEAESSSNSPSAKSFDSERKQNGSQGAQTNEVKIKSSLRGSALADSQIDQSSVTKGLQQREDVDTEHLDDIRQGQLEPILWKLEMLKGTKMDIAAFKEMQKLRTKRNKACQSRLDEWISVDKNDKKQRHIIDSSHVIGAKIILEYLRRRKLNNGQQDDQDNQSQLSRIVRQSMDTPTLRQQSRQDSSADISPVVTMNINENNFQATSTLYPSIAVSPKAQDNIEFSQNRPVANQSHSLTPNKQSSRVIFQQNNLMPQIPEQDEELRSYNVSQEQIIERRREIPQEQASEESYSQSFDQERNRVAMDNNQQANNPDMINDFNPNEVALQNHESKRPCNLQGEDNEVLNDLVDNQDANEDEVQINSSMEWPANDSSP